MPPPSDHDTRTRILDAAGRHFRQRGFVASGIKKILAESRAPYGSLYHHFPGGKIELGVTTIRDGGEIYRQLVVEYFDGEQPIAECVRALFEGAAALLEATDYQDACPIATMALEVANTNDAMRSAAAAAFESWLEVLARRLRRDGCSDGDARRIAIQVFCAIEGAFLLARTTRSTEALAAAGRGLVESLGRSAADADSPKRGGHHGSATTVTPS